MRRKKPDNRIAIGKGGSGKSTLVRSWLVGHKRILIHDTAEEPEIKRLASDVIYTRSDLIARIMAGGSFVIAWRGFATEGKDAFEYGNRAALAGEDMLIVWEELDIYFDGSGSTFSPLGFQIVHTGRHKGLTTITTSRAPGLIPKKLTRNVQRIAVFKTDEPGDLRYLAEKIGAANADRIQRLGEYQYLDWTDDQATGQAKIRKTKK